MRKFLISRSGTRLSSISLVGRSGIRPATHQHAQRRAIVYSLEPPKLSQVHTPRPSHKSLREIFLALPPTSSLARSTAVFTILLSAALPFASTQTTYTWHCLHGIIRRAFVCMTGWSPWVSTTRSLFADRVETG